VVVVPVLRRAGAAAVSGSSGGRSAAALSNIGWFQALLGDYEQARGSCREALALFQQLGSQRPRGSLVVIDPFAATSLHVFCRTLLTLYSHGSLMLRSCTR
jgi:hypothetical protein